MSAAVGRLSYTRELEGEPANSKLVARRVFPGNPLRAGRALTGLSAWASLLLRPVILVFLVSLIDYFAMSVAGLKLGRRTSTGSPLQSRTSTMMTHPPSIIGSFGPR